MSGTKTLKNEESRKPLPEVYKLLQDRGWPEIERMFDTPREFFPGQLVAGRSRLSADSKILAENFGMSEGRQSANKFFGDLMGGKFLTDSNPYLDDVSKAYGDRASEQYKRITMPSTMSRFAAAGRSNSDSRDRAIGQNERNLAEGLTRANADIFKGDFDMRFAQMMQGLSMAPAYQAMDMNDIAVKRQQGAIEEGYAQQAIDEEIRRFQFAQSEPDMRLDAFLSRLGQTTAGFGTSTGSRQIQDNTGLAIGMGLLGSMTQIMSPLAGGAGSLGQGFMGSNSAASGTSGWAGGTGGAISTSGIWGGAGGSAGGLNSFGAGYHAGGTLASSGLGGGGALKLAAFA